MFRSAKWTFVLAILAFAPSIAMAGPFSWIKSKTSRKPAANSPVQQVPSNGAYAPVQNVNQAVAQKIAQALQVAKITGFNLQIDYNNGIATLNGVVRDETHRVRASQAVQALPEVYRVNNMLQLVDTRIPIDQQVNRVFNRGNRRNGNILQVSGEKSPATGSRVQTADGNSITQYNQKMAESIGQALVAAGLRGYDIEIKFENGVATLLGKISDPQQKQLASQVLANVEGVQRVDNQLLLMTGNGGRVAEQPGPQNNDDDAISRHNQAMAEQVASALAQAGLTGYDIEIRFQQGQLQLLGSVATQQQWMNASEVVMKVPGVQSVDNRLTIAAPPSENDPVENLTGPDESPGDRRQLHGPLTRNIAQTNPQDNATSQPPVTGADRNPWLPYYHPANYQPQARPGEPTFGPPGAAGTNSMFPHGPMANGGPQAGGMPNNVSNSPNLPDHAWPSYAAYPNYAGVQYPSQYSASAWPYIGPFYPYPQIPLGWRQVQLEWDDGYWNLNFKPRTSKWWWFMNPKNWD